MTPAGAWNRKDLLGIAELSPAEIELVLDTAESFREVAERPIKKVPTLRGTTVVNLFFEPSTRTRVSLRDRREAAVGRHVNFASAGSSLEKGETLLDTARNLAGDGAGHRRHPPRHPGVPHLLASAPAGRR